ncbi:MAG: hypothetical protein H7Y13_11035 [Sphingobacteriaceae bacterium]|nr:hypothetical protein [Sphingobacteriaceae bacterium]
MKKILIALTVFASVTAASAQQKKPAQKKAEIKKEVSGAKKDCCAKDEADDCCAPAEKTKTVSSVKKAPAKKG